MISINSGEKLLPVPEAVEKATGYRPHPTTCTRWTRRGLKGITLETVYVGGRPRTTVQAVKEFIEKTTAEAYEH